MDSVCVLSRVTRVNKRHFPSSPSRHIYKLTNKTPTEVQVEANWPDNYTWHHTGHCSSTATGSPQPGPHNESDCSCNTRIQKSFFYWIAPKPLLTVQQLLKVNLNFKLKVQPSIENIHIPKIFTELGQSLHSSKRAVSFIWPLSNTSPAWTWTTISDDPPMLTLPWQSWHLLSSPVMCHVSCVTEDSPTPQDRVTLPDTKYLRLRHNCHAGHGVTESRHPAAAPLTRVLNTKLKIPLRLKLMSSVINGLTLWRTKLSSEVNLFMPQLTSTYH